MKKIQEQMLTQTQAPAALIQNQAATNIQEAAEQQPTMLIQEDSNNKIISEPGSQVSHYQFGVDSATQPGGYRY